MKISVNTLPKSLERLVDLLQEGLKSKEGLNPRKAKEIVLQADVQVEDMMNYADFDHPIEDNYGRKMVFDGGNFEVMVMSWRPGDYSSIHNHGYTQWGVVQVFGNVHHFCYTLKDETLNFSRREILTSGAAIKVNNALIHQMGNPNTESYLTLHVYGSNQVSSDVTADAANYDLEHSRISHTTGGAFFNLQDDQIYDIQEGLKSTPEVFLNYAKHLMAYYNRQPATPEIMVLKQQLVDQIQQRFINQWELN